MLIPLPIDLLAGVAVVAVAAPIELRTEHIPNWLTLGGLLCAVGLMFVERRFGLHVLGFLAGSVPALAFYRAKWMGGGSVKLIAASSTLGGPWIAVGALLGLLPPYLRGRFGGPRETPGSPWILLGVVAAACAVFVVR